MARREPNPDYAVLYSKENMSFDDGLLLFEPETIVEFCKRQGLDAEPLLKRRAEAQRRRLH